MWERVKRGVSRDKIWKMVLENLRDSSTRSHNEADRTKTNW